MLNLFPCNIILIEQQEISIYSLVGKALEKKVPFSDAGTSKYSTHFYYLNNLLFYMGAVR